MSNKKAHGLFIYENILIHARECTTVLRVESTVIVESVPHLTLQIAINYLLLFTNFFTEKVY